MAKIPVFPVPAAGGGGIKWTKLIDEAIDLNITATGTTTYTASKSFQLIDTQYDLYMMVLSGTLAISLKSGITDRLLEGAFSCPIGGKSISSSDGKTVSDSICCRSVLVPDETSDWPNVTNVYARPFNRSGIKTTNIKVEISAERMHTVTSFEGHISIHGGRYEF